MKTIRNIFSLVLAGSAMVVITSCEEGNPNSPGVEFMPDMYRSPSLETNMTAYYKDDTMMVNHQPVRGTVPRGYLPEIYTPDDTAGYENAGKFLKNPLPVNEQVLAEGKNLYTTYCSQCHGDKGTGDGKVGAKLPGPPPSYTSPNLVNLAEGKMYYSISYGKGIMGPHGPLMSREERWKVVHYIREVLQKPAETTAAADTAATNAQAPAAK